MSCGFFLHSLGTVLANSNRAGGNKRKLSVALALIGNPALLLLDEPTSGMDPHAQHFLWGAIKEVVNLPGRSVVFTSHSMHECELLCHRLGEFLYFRIPKNFYWNLTLFSLAIMVNGQFRCLGSPQHLKSTFGQGYSLLLKLCGSLNASRDVEDSSTTNALNFVLSTFPGSAVRERHHG